MEDRLRETICTAKAQNIIVKDICFSGNGEPTISPDFPAALRAAAMLRDADAPDAQIVIITNGTGLLHKETFNVLKTANVGYKNVMPWIKLDAGTEDWYKKIDVSNIPYADLIEAIQMYADGSPSPFIIQTMHCAVNNEEPSLHELAAWTERVVKLSGAGNVVAAHIYGKARPSPGDPVCSALPLASLQNRARLLESALAAAGLAAIPVEVFE
jgi:histidinol dehydrogenase